MFMFGWRNYMDHAFPQDDLRPLSCSGQDTQGGFGNTLVDCLDTLVVRFGARFSAPFTTPACKQLRGRTAV